MIRTSASALRSVAAMLGRSGILVAIVLLASSSARAIDVTAAWSPIAGYQTEYQGGAPANGWNYAWSPTGKYGNANGFAKLKWSSTSQGYNTTGDVATSTKKKKKKKASSSASLLLQASGGNPGKSNFLPIVGYTIQPGDGPGEYRLMDSSIAKADGILSKKEDGLGVMVYLNNTSMGPTQLVSTNGLMSTFDRGLGQLNVGDTIWVMVNPLKNTKFDTFHRFDFTLEKRAALTEPGGGSSDEPDLNVPEPGTAALVLLTLGCIPRTRRRAK